VILLVVGRRCSATVGEPSANRFPQYRNVSMSWQPGREPAATIMRLRPATHRSV